MLAAAIGVLGLRVFQPSGDGAPLELQWEAPPSCPDGAAVTREVHRLLGQVGAQGQSLSVRGRVVSGGDGYELTLKIGDAGGRRTLRAASCEELSKTAALIVAMTIDPSIGDVAVVEGDATQRIPEPTESSSPPEPKGPREGAVLSTTPSQPPNASPQSPNDSPESPNTSPQSPNPLAFVGRLQAGPAFGPLPSLTGSLALGLGVAGRAWRVEGVGQYWIPVRSEPAAGSDAQVLAQLWSVGVRGCYEPGLSSVVFPLCGGIDAGMMIGRGREVDRPRSAQTAWAAAVGSAGVLWWFSHHVGLGGQVDAHAALHRPAFRIDPGLEAHVARPGGVQGLFGLFVRAP